MNKINYTRRAALVGGAVALALSSAARAADTREATVSLEEIVVTAQKRAENLQIVPISVSAFTGEDIEQRSLQNVGEVLASAPNVIRASGPSTGDDGFYFFRGVGQVDNSANVEPGVGVYIDDVYLGRVQGASFDVLDIERIEVLRGPQGTLFGRNTIGGAVSATTRDPGKEFGGKARVTLGDRERRDAMLSVDVPITDSTGMLISAFTRNQDGWAENPITGDRYGDREDIGARVKLVVDATETLTLKVTGDYNKGEGTSLPTVLLDNTVAPGFGFLGIPHPADMNADRDLSPFDETVGNSIDPALESERGGLAVHAIWDLGDMQFKSITARRKTNQDAWTDLDGTLYSVYDFNFVVEQDQFSQEFQLSGTSERVDWLVGVFYYEEDLLNHTTAGVGTNTGGGFLPPAGPGQPPGLFYNPAVRLDRRELRFQSNLYQDTTSYAGFGQVSFKFTEQLKGTLGLRYTRDEKEMRLDNYSDNLDGVFSPLCYLPMPPGMAICAREGEILYTASGRPGSQSELAGLSTSFSDSWSETTPKVGFDYQLNDSFMTYVSWSNGFKAGGFQGRATPGNEAPSFDPETLETYEVGFKSEFFDRRVRLNAAAFFTKYKDTQMLVFEPVGNTFITANAGDSEIKGVEVELVARPVSGLDLSLAGGYMENEYTRLDPGAAAFGITEEDELPYTPQLTVAVGAQYSWDIGAAGALSLRADYNWRDDFYFQAANNPLDLQEAYGLLDLRATWTSPDQKLSVAAFGRNVTDEEYYSSLNDQRFGFVPLGVALGTVAPPRDYGVEFGYRF